MALRARSQLTFMPALASLLGTSVLPSKTVGAAMMGAAMVGAMSLSGCTPPPAEHAAGAAAEPSVAATGPASTGPAAAHPAPGNVVEPLSLPEGRGGPTVVGRAPDSSDEDASSLLQSEPEPGELPAAASTMQVLPGGVGVEDIVVGSGPEVQPGMKLEVHYVGRLQDGSEFDSSRKRNRPFVYEFGAGRVIQGWEDGIAGMRVGGVRRLLIPPHKGYGQRSTGSIPANSILDFEIELLSAQ